MYFGDFFLNLKEKYPCVNLETFISSDCEMMCLAKSSRELNSMCNNPQSKFYMNLLSACKQQQIWSDCTDMGLN